MSEIKSPTNLTECWSACRAGYWLDPEKGCVSPCAAKHKCTMFSQTDKDIIADCRAQFEFLKKLTRGPNVYEIGKDGKRVRKSLRDVLSKECTVAISVIDDYADREDQR